MTNSKLNISYKSSHSYNQNIVQITLTSVPVQRRLMFIWFCHTHSTRVLTRAKILKLSLFWKSDFLVLLLKCIVGSLSSKGGGIFWGNARDTSPADQRHQDNSFLHTSRSPCHYVTTHHVTMSQCHTSGSPCHRVTVLQHNFKVLPLSALVEYNSFLHTFGSQICFLVYCYTFVI